MLSKASVTQTYYNTQPQCRNYIFINIFLCRAHQSKTKSDGVHFLKWATFYHLGLKKTCLGKEIQPIQQYSVRHMEVCAYIIDLLYTMRPIAGFIWADFGDKLSLLSLLPETLSNYEAFLTALVYCFHLSEKWQQAQAVNNKYAGMFTLTVT